MAVNQLGFELHLGEILGLIGPNGSGKTTALNLISGALKPTSGTIVLDNHAIAGMPPHRIARLGLARTFQLVRPLSSLTCLENVVAGMAFRRQSVWGDAAHGEALALIERVGLAGRANALAGELTYIDQKRMELARALASMPRVLLLDEFLAGLNPTELHSGIELIKSLREEGHTIILVEHVMDAIHSLCDRCIVMNAGAMIACAPPRDVFKDRAVVSAYLGDEDA
jgi:ABC-type branched-subunit amino acid transport system ATPase component